MNIMLLIAFGTFLYYFLLGLLICIVYFVIGSIVAGAFKVDEFNDFAYFILLWPIALVAYLFLVLISFSLTIGDKLSNKLEKLIFREKK